MREPIDVTALEDDLRRLRDALLAAESAHASEIAAVHPRHRRSAANLVHYVELRNHDVRDVQERLATLGLSSLGRAEAHVLATIEAVLAHVAGLDAWQPLEPAARVSISEGRTLLDANADLLLGPPPLRRATRIMVTLPTEAAEQPELIAMLGERGMDLARVNCAHDDERTWTRMISHVRDLPGEVRVAVDLGGPKLRTGPFEPGPQVLRIAPARDRFGRVTAPALVHLVADGVPRTTCDEDGAVIPVIDHAWLHRRAIDDELELTDSRGSHRRWTVTEVGPHGCTATTAQTAYVETGTKITCCGDDAAVVGELPNREQAHRVMRHDRIVLTRELTPAAPVAGADIHRIGCTLREAFDAARPGQRVLLDDGKIGGLIGRVTPDEIELTVTNVRPAARSSRRPRGSTSPTPICPSRRSPRRTSTICPSSRRTPTS